MPKTGLPIYFDRFGEHVIWIGIYCCIACFLICEWLVHRERYVARNPDSIEELGAHNDNTKLIDDEDSFEVCFFLCVLCISSFKIDQSLIVSESFMCPSNCNLLQCCCWSLYLRFYFDHDAKSCKS